MEYRNLGRTGLKVSELCLGSMQFGWSADEALSHQILDAAWEAGVNFIDTADVYSRWVPGNPGGVSETILGNWLKNKSLSRHQIILATKVRGRMGDGPNDEGLSRQHIMQAVEASLRRLNTDYIDLYQTHWDDEATPIEETLTTLNDLVRQGKVRYLGCSNYSAWRLTEALLTATHLGLARFDCLQPHYSLVKRTEFEGDLAQVCRQYGVGVIPYSPLGGGFLTGKHRPGKEADGVRKGAVQRYFTEQNWKTLDVLQQVANENGGHSLSQVALAWLLGNPLVTAPIIGPRTEEQAQDNLAAAGLHLTPEQMERLNAVSAVKSD